MDLEFREGIACMNLGLPFSSSLLLFLGYPHHFRFTQHFLYLTMCTGPICSFESIGLLFCIPGHLRAGTFGWLDFVDLTVQFKTIVAHFWDHLIL